MYADFEQKQPEITRHLKLSKWKQILHEEVWQIKKAYRSMSFASASGRVMGRVSSRSAG